MSTTSPAGALSVAAVAAEAEAAVAAVLACPAVASLHTGGLRRVATYLPGRRVDGVRVDEDGIEVDVVMAYGVPVAAVDQQVRAALAPLARGRRVDLRVGDLQLPEEQQLALPPAPA